MSSSLCISFCEFLREISSGRKGRKHYAFVAVTGFFCSSYTSFATRWDVNKTVLVVFISAVYERKYNFVTSHS
jgi:hypothetical protein